MLSRVFIRALLIGFVALGVWSCERQETGEMGEMAEDAAMQEGEAMQGEGMQEMQEMQEMALPDTTGAAVWSYLEAADYRANWELWPGKGELYAGQEPHGALLTTYVNPAAHEAATSMAGSMPAGAIVVKENYMPDSTLAAITIMYKVEGYDPANNNWYWVKRLADGTIEVEGRGAGCIGCHAAQKSNDYIFTGSLSGQM
jgi:hypothetical protein